MKPINLFIYMSVSFFIISCAVPPPQNNYRGSTLYESRTELNASLFENDKSQISQDAVDKILEGVINLGDSNKVAVYKVENQGSGIAKYYGWNYWLSEEYLDLEQQYFDTLISKLHNKRISVIKSLPSILTPKELSISKLREAAVRLQATFLIVYSVQSNVFEKYKLFSPNEVKAYSTCEMILFHTKTGIIPFSEVVTKKVLENQLQDDANIIETRKRAESKAIIESLKELGIKLNKYLEEK